MTTVNWPLQNSPYGGDEHDLGWFLTSAALIAAYPLGVAGDHAIVATTDTVWVWDTDTNSWKDSGSASTITYPSRVLSIDGALVLGDSLVKLDGSANTVALTLLAPALCTNKKYTIKCINLTHACTIVGTIDGVSGYSFAAVNTSIDIQSDGVAFWIL